MMPMQNSLAQRLSGMGTQPPGPTQSGAVAQPQPAQPVTPQPQGVPPQNSFARPGGPGMMPGQAPVMMPRPVASGSVQMQPAQSQQMQPQAQGQPQSQASPAQPPQNNLRRMMAY